MYFYKLTVFVFERRGKENEKITENKNKCILVSARKMNNESDSQLQKVSFNDRLKLILFCNYKIEKNDSQNVWWTLGL